VLNKIKKPEDSKSQEKAKVIPPPEKQQIELSLENDGPIDIQKLNDTSATKTGDKSDKIIVTESLAE